MISIECPTPSDAQHPDWKQKGRGPCHNWHNWVSDEIAAVWDTFTPAQRDLIARLAQQLADGEEWD